MKILIAVTGASALEVAEKLVNELKARKNQVYLIVTDGARKLAKEEGFDLSVVERLADKIYDNSDLGASLSSSSNPPDATVVVPASLKTIGKIANGIQDELVIRVANNTLRLGRKLVVCPRETPVSAIDLENMARIARAGGIILPLNIAFYFKPKGIEDLINFIVGKIMDVLEIENNIYAKWKQNDNNRN